MRIFKKKYEMNALYTALLSCFRNKKALYAAHVYFFVESNAFAALRVYFKVRNAQFKRKPCSRQYIFGDGFGQFLV